MLRCKKEYSNFEIDQFEKKVFWFKISLLTDKQSLKWKSKQFFSLLAHTHTEIIVIMMGQLISMDYTIKIFLQELTALLNPTDIAELRIITSS